MMGLSHIYVKIDDVIDLRAFIDNALRFSLLKNTIQQVS